MKFTEEQKKFLKSNRKMMIDIFSNFRDEIRDIGLTYPRGEERDSMLDTANYIDEKLVKFFENKEENKKDDEDDLPKWI